MIVLYILLSILLLIALVLFLNVSFVFELKEEFSFKIRVLFVTLKGDTIVKLAEGRTKEDSSKEETNTPKSKIKKPRGISDTIESISAIIDLIKAIFGEFIRYARLKVCYVDVKIATDDAAHTALIYGAASSAIYLALEFLDTLVTLKKNYKKVSVYPDFTTDKTEAKLKIILKIKPIHVIFAAVHLLPVLADKKKGK